MNFETPYQNLSTSPIEVLGFSYQQLLEDGFCNELIEYDGQELYQMARLNLCKQIPMQEISTLLCPPSPIEVTKEDSNDLHENGLHFRTSSQKFRK